MKSYNMHPFETGFFPSASCCWVSSMLFSVSVVHFYCQVIFHCVAVPHFVMPLNEYWDCFQFGAILKIRLWSFVYMSWCGCLFPFFLGRYLGVECLGHMLSICLTFEETIRLFSKVEVAFFILYSEQQCTGFRFPHILANTWYIICPYSYSKESVCGGYIIVVLICVSCSLLKLLSITECVLLYW